MKYEIGQKIAYPIEKGFRILSYIPSSVADCWKIYLDDGMGLATEVWMNKIAYVTHIDFGKTYGIYNQDGKFWLIVVE